MEQGFNSLWRVSIAILGDHSLNDDGEGEGRIHFADAGLVANFFFVTVLACGCCFDRAALK